MMDLPPITLLTSLPRAIAAGGLAWYVGQAALEIRYVTLADGRLQERKLPLLFRLVAAPRAQFDRLAEPPGLHARARAD